MEHDTNACGLRHVANVIVCCNCGGFPRLVSLVKNIEASTENVLKFHAGDAITGTSFYSLFKGKADADMMNRICFDAVGLGNHGKFLLAIAKT